MIKNKRDYKDYLYKDKMSLGIHESFLRRVFFPDRVCLFERQLRRLEYLNNCKHGLFWKIVMLYAKIRFYKLSVKLGFSIPINVFGPGLSIAHYGNIVVNSNARIGANCRLHSGVNIGASGGGKNAPIIGDNCYIGPGAIIFGDITLADNITIGANATVNRSCDQERVVLAGTPAKMVKENTNNWLEFNKVKSSKTDNEQHNG